MIELDNVVDLLIENIKKFFFPSEWINLDLKFSKTEIFTLLLLDKEKEVTMTELVDYINSPMSTATGIVDRLVRNGYISRDRSEADRRIVVIKLTDAGANLIKDFKDLISKYVKLILDDLTEEEKKFMIAIVFKIMNKLQAEMANSNTKDEKKATIKKIDIE